NGEPIYYKVGVDAIADIGSAKAEFDCEVKKWDPKNDTIGKNVVEPITVRSDLTNVREHDFAYETYTGDEVDRYSNPKKPSSLLNPKTRVSELTNQEKQDRMDQD
ncbi:MAG: hypothetical protein AAFQ98_21695, partial [Bacteroidota bacterium]